MYILGLSLNGHDTAACLIKDGQIIALCEEERLARVKRITAYPFRAIDYCLKEAGIGIKDIDYTACSWDSRIEFNKFLLGHSLKFFPKSLLHFREGLRGWRARKSRAGYLQRKFGIKSYAVNHHLAHGSSSFFVSPFNEAAILTLDGAGEFDTVTLGIGQDKKIRTLESIVYPHSLGLLYDAVSIYLGFTELEGAGKVMGLDYYGKPLYLKEFKRIVKFKPEGKFELDLSYFQYHLARRAQNEWVTAKFLKAFGLAREIDGPLDQRHMDIAASLQQIVEEAIFHMAERLFELTGQKNLCISGGVALNSVANAKLLANSRFKKFYIQPLANDAGGALGAAYYLYHQIFGQPRSAVMAYAYLGPSFTDEEIETSLNSFSGLKVKKLTNIEKETAKLLSEGKIIGWLQGRMEGGPRALGNRSIIVDPRNPQMMDILNKRVKFREAFRPFAPSILEEYNFEYFKTDYPSPFMLMVYEAREDKRRLIPAVVHVDGTGRVQTVNRNDNPRYRRLIEEFHKITGVPVLLNTSFNIRGEPIVCTPEDAIVCFLGTDMDYLVLGDFLVNKE